jgi:hypothetical protein
MLPPRAVLQLSTAPASGSAKVAAPQRSIIGSISANSETCQTEFLKGDAPGILSPIQYVMMANITRWRGLLLYHGVLRNYFIGNYPKY